MLVARCVCAYASTALSMSSFLLVKTLTHMHTLYPKPQVALNCRWPEVARVSQASFNWRLRALPALYTAFYEARVRGCPVRADPTRVGALR